MDAMDRHYRIHITIEFIPARNHFIVHIVHRDLNKNLTWTHTQNGIQVKIGFFNAKNVKAILQENIF